MERTRRRAVGYVLLILGVFVVFTVAYDYGMSAFEGRPRSLLESVQVVVQTFTTTGYGEDAPWRSAEMLALMIVMQLSGIFLIFLTLPLFVVPWLEQRMQYRPQTEFEGSEHVVLCGFTERGRAIIEELEARDVEYVVIVEERETAREMYEEGYEVMVGDGESAKVLETASVPDARAVVLDRGDETNANIALAAREISDTVRVVAFVDDYDLAPYIRLAGVDDVLHPRRLLGRGLADKVTSTLTTRLGDTVAIGGDLEIIELPLQTGCELEGVRLEKSDIRERTGANVIGAWIGGEFVPNPDPSTELNRNMVLLVSGTESQLEAAKDLTRPGDEAPTGHMIIAGYGDVGRTVQRRVSMSVQSTTVIDAVDKPGVDVVGDARDASTFEAANIDEAGAIIVTLASDPDTVFATLVARKLNSDVEIICRADDTNQVSKLYNAGADYVLALSTVAGRMLAESILDEEVITYETQIDVVRTEAPAYVGQTVSEAAIRKETGCTVVAVEREGQVYTELGPSFTIESGDLLFVAGSDENIATFHDVAGLESGAD
ncbi:MAG: TrkA family potassium uptake protein [Halodesulfurarchaeum sp.]